MVQYGECWEFSGVFHSVIENFLTFVLHCPEPCRMSFVEGRLSKGEHPIATRSVSAELPWLSAHEYRLRFSVWSARNAFAVAQSDLTFPGEINRLAEDPRGFLRRVKAG